MSFELGQGAINASTCKELGLHINYAYKISNINLSNGMENDLPKNR